MSSILTERLLLVGCSGANYKKRDKKRKRKKRGEERRKNEGKEGERN